MLVLQNPNGKPVAYTVGDLKSTLKKCKDTDKIIMLSDEEGNDEQPLFGVEINKNFITLIPAHIY